MADSDKPGPKKPDISIEQRLLLAFVLMGAVLFVTQYFYKPAPPKAIVKQTEPAKPQQQSAPAPPPDTPKGAAPPSQVVAAPKEELFTIDTALYRIVFSNRGAVVQSWQLKKYHDGTGKPLELVNTAAASKVYYPFSLIFTDQKPATDLNQALYIAKPAPDGLGIDYEFADGQNTARKSFRFTRNSYLAQLTTEVLQGTAAVPHLIAWRGGFGDSTVLKAAGNQHAVYFEAADNKLIQNDSGTAKNGPVSVTGAYAYAGIEDNFFAAVFLPQDGKSLQLQTLNDPVPTAVDPKTEEPHVGAAVGGSGQNAFSLFVGPKDLDLMRKVDPRLESLINFGRWLGFLAKPLFLALNWVNDRWVHNYGWSIVVVTIIINFLLLPLKFSSMKSMKKMQVLAPQIAAINKKYEGIGLRDPKKADQNAEVMALYKREGVNPAGGCFPMVLQIPFFISFYTVLTVAIEMRGAQWLWVNDLSQPETLAIRILPLALIATQFLLQKISPATSADPAQQKVMMLMPLMMGFMFYGVSSGLVLYWLTGNVVGMAQQWFFNRAMPTPAVTETRPVKKKSPRV
ncbi:MAG TPA: membrane protein insertase YidC [Bryobacteraceae bacterium]|nr:membrane protein insertase YidC [Bryobacteraceae bacterium]